MSLRRPFANGSRVAERAEKQSLPIPSPPMRMETTLGVVEDKDMLERGLRTLEELLRSLGFEGALAEKVRQRMVEIDRDISRIEAEIAKLEGERNRLLKEKERIASVIRAFSGVA
ncbi:hypothetical protein [Infirmifilum sp. NZ]|uniref:hypothetical protein n=1 Tax=Infirmifilum sp. NZ TaxID=2926850 RepID=UPI0027A6CD94|nr:hypothetical protein [Infirmifilum sp. NZ]UNQ72739.1 hypothetical protein MOV14_06380 [Infirmifilum sp. NZ]